MPNDVPMLTWAGTSFAVANGHPDARAAADRTCPDNDDDGVALVLERMLETAS
ncbi:MAG: HAD family hydrolase [Nocardioidaceae bacterium]